jgi:RNA polymerase sigma-70 factor (ECF subfamily)
MDRRSQEWRRAVYRCQALLGNREDAEDCVQDALLAALSQGPGTIADLEGFVTAVARRRAIDRIRHRQVRQNTLPRLAHRDESTTPDIAEAVTNRGEAVWLVQKLDALPPATRAVIEALAAGKSLTETAAELGLTYRAAESHVTRARRFARGWLAGPVTVLSGLWAALRRTASTAPAAGLALSIACIVTVSRHPAPLNLDEGARTAPHTAAVARMTQTAGQQRPASRRPVANNATGRRPKPVGAPRARRPAPGPIAEAEVPGGAVGLREEQRPGPDDPVSNISGCLERFEVTLERIGC